MIKLLENYAGLRKGSLFRVLEVGVDWVRISAHGKPLYVPKNFFEE